MARFIHLLTIFALLVFSSHAMAYVVKNEQPRAGQHESIPHHGQEHKDHSQHVAMPICIICLAAGMMITEFTPPASSTDPIQPNLMERFTGKSLRPPTPPPKYVV